MDEPAVRLASPADAGAVAQLLTDFNLEFESAIPELETLSQRFARLLDDPDVAVVVADRGRPIGFALVTLRPTPYYDGPLAVLDELYVAPAHRGGGIGSEVLSVAIAEARRRGVEEMHINVDEIDAGARRFYERHGFVNIEPGTDYRMLCYLKEF